MMSRWAGVSHIMLGGMSEQAIVINGKLISECIYMMITFTFLNNLAELGKEYWKIVTEAIVAALIIEQVLWMCQEWY